jgi:hypothetical protein
MPYSFCLSLLLAIARRTGKHCMDNSFPMHLRSRNQVWGFTCILSAALLTPSKKPRLIQKANAAAVTLVVFFREVLALLYVLLHGFSIAKSNICGCPFLQQVDVRAHAYWYGLFHNLTIGKLYVCMHFKVNICEREKSQTFTRS